MKTLPVTRVVGPAFSKVGDAVRLIRKRLGLTQVAFSQSLGIRQHSLSQIETDRARPSIARLIYFLRLAKTDDERAPILQALERRGILSSDLTLGDSPTHTAMPQELEAGRV